MNSNISHSSSFSYFLLSYKLIALLLNSTSWIELFFFILYISSCFSYCQITNYPSTRKFLDFTCYIFFYYLYLLILNCIFLDVSYYSWYFLFFILLILLFIVKLFSCSPIFLIPNHIYRYLFHPAILLLNNILFIYCYILSITLVISLLIKQFILFQSS
jgi:hypothetical protein